MAPLNIFILFLALSTYKITSSSLVNPDTIYISSDYINVMNMMGKGKVVTLRCYSNKGFSTPIQSLDYGETVYWDSPVSFKAPVINTCDMSSLDPHVHGTFDVFNSVTDFRSDKCADDQCLWQVRVDGLWVYIKNGFTYRKEYNWTPTSSSLPDH